MKVWIPKSVFLSGRNNLACHVCEMFLLQHLTDQKTNTLTKRRQSLLCVWADDLVSSAYPETYPEKHFVVHSVSLLYLLKVRELTP